MRMWRWAGRLGLLLVAALAACDQAPQGHLAPAQVSPLPAIGMPPPPAPPATAARLAPPPANFANRPESPYRDVREQPVSTISLASDTASYGIARRLLRAGQVPDPRVIRPEEFLNAFRFDYAPPRDRRRPFAPTVSVHPAPWDASRLLLHIGIRTTEPPAGQRPPLNLVFLIDTSGSMRPSDRLDLVRQGLRMLLPQLEARDRISIVTYAGKTDVALDSARGDQRQVIEDALARLQPEGSTAGGSGIEKAYNIAIRNFRQGAVNRVILATDGDFNLGITDPLQLEALIKSYRDRGIYLTTIGVGLDNLTDVTMHALARAGNGIYAYAGDAADMHRALVQDFGANLLPVANDVKLQVEFNPARVREWRLIGFETRQLRQQDFENDRVDAGEIGSGRAITAIYEFVPRGSSRAPRYAGNAPAGRGGEFAFLRIRYKLPGEDRAQEIDRAITPADARPSFAAASTDARFAAAVVGFAQLLRRSDQVQWPMQAMIDTANAARGQDADGSRADFVALLRLSASLLDQPAR